MSTFCALCKGDMVLIRGIYACDQCDHTHNWPSHIWPNIRE